MIFCYCSNISIMYTEIMKKTLLITYIRVNSSFRLLCTVYQTVQSIARPHIMFYHKMTSPINMPRNPAQWLIAARLRSITHSHICACCCYCVQIFTHVFGWIEYSCIYIKYLYVQKIHSQQIYLCVLKSSI